MYQTPERSANLIHVDPNTMKLHTRRRPARCPWCGSEAIAVMLNGIPVSMPDRENAWGEGEIVVGRRLPQSEGPAWRCTECYAEFFREDEDTPESAEGPVPAP